MHCSVLIIELYGPAAALPFGFSQFKTGVVGGDCSNVLLAGCNQCDQNASAFASTLTAVEYNDAFDDEADAMLLRLAATESAGDWDSANAGAWKVLSERLLYSETVLLLSATRDQAISLIASHRD